MRVHLPALLALVSATTYVACGSSDRSAADQEAGANGEGGDANDSGGSSNRAGSSNGAGTKNSGGGDSSNGGAPIAPGGEGGAAGSSRGGSGGEEALGGDAGAAGAAGASSDPTFPELCPGVLADYTRVDGTSGADTFVTAQLAGKTLVLGLEGDDIFDTNHDGQDCLIGGPGDDDLTNPGENVSYLFGGPGADTFHLIAQLNNYAFIADMSSEDTIGLSKTTFTFLDGVAGATPSDYQLQAIDNYSSGTGTVPPGEGAAIVYDPVSGELWQDTDRGDNTSGAVKIATVVNAAAYTYDIDDFVLDD
jgi:hypothetical protein